jgi:hypothetical protein
MTSPSSINACAEASEPPREKFDAPLSKEPRVEPPTDVAGSEELLGVAAVEFISVRELLFSPSTLRLADYDAIGFQTLVIDLI